MYKKILLVLKMNTAVSPASAKLHASYAIAVANRHVLDVSNLQADGVGARSMVYPKTLTGAKKWVDNLPIISNSYYQYAAAMELLGPNYRQFAELFLKQHGNGKFERQATVKRYSTTPFPPGPPALVVTNSQVVPVTQPRSPSKATVRPKTPRSQAVRPKTSRPKMAQAPAYQQMVPMPTYQQMVPAPGYQQMVPAPVYRSQAPKRRV